jgi:hypothetical protein
MRKWGDRSKEVLQTLDEDLQWLCNTILYEVADVSLTCGHRTQAEQDALYPLFTKLQWPNGKHNSYPSRAVDLQPHPLPETEEKLWGALGYIAGRAVEIGKRRGLKVRWGGDWDGDGDLTDQSFDDLFHIELRK